MIHKLETFEIKFDDELLIQGEDLYQNNAVEKLSEIEKHLWEIQIIDGKIYEVEILITPSKIRKFSCECDDYKSSKKCNHVIAGLFALRNLKAKQKKAKELKKKKTPKFAQNLRVKEILPLVDHQELRDFVNFQLRKDKKLALKFKARFAQKVKVTNGRNKYLQILDELIKPVTDVKKKMSGEHIALFLQISEEYTAQLGDLVSIQRYSEAFELISALMQKTLYVHSNAKVYEEKVLKFVRELHANWWEFYDVINVPDLKANMVKYATELAGHSYYDFTDPQIDLYQFLYQNSSFIESDFLDSLSRKIIRIFKSHQDCSYLISAFYKLVNKIQDFSGFKQIEELLRIRLEFISRVLDIYTRLHDYKHLEDFLQFINAHKIAEDLDLNSYKINLLIEKKDYEKVKNLIVGEYIKSHKALLIHKLDGLDAFHREEILQEIEKQFIIRENTPALLDYYKETKQFDKLLAIISEQPTMMSLEKYAGYYWNDHQELMTKLHILVYTEYLKTHIGYINSQLIGEKIERVKRFGMTKAARLIKEEVFKSYSSRSSLKEAFKKV